MAMAQYFLNPRSRSYPTPVGLFDAKQYRLVSSLSSTRPTPLRHLPGLAAEFGVRDILLKDESTRMGLESFKILGVSYAVRFLINQGRINSSSVLVCASEGNHGRAVARAARDHGLAARVYVPANCAATRIEAIEKEGADVVRTNGNYDDAVRLVIQDATRKDWTIVSDTSWPGYEEVPRLIMAGYTMLLTEAEDQWLPASPPDVVLVQAGVGGLACAVVSWLCHRYGAQRPFTIACEPLSAACLLESARSGKPQYLRGPFNTMMAGLRCGEVSHTAWPTIQRAVDAFVSIEDEYCERAMRSLAHPVNNDPVVVAGVSGACGLGALLALVEEENLRPLRNASRLNTYSRILVINTEGATDPELHSQVTGESVPSLRTTP